MRTLLILSLLSVPQFAVAETQTQTFETKDLKTLVVKNGAGLISVKVAEDGKAHIAANKKSSDKKCEVKMERKGNKLVAEVREPMIGNCNVDIEVKVPKQTSFDLSLGSGDITVDGIVAKEGELKVGNGNVTLAGDFADLEAKVGNGEVSAKGLSGDAEVDIGNGKVALEYAKAPTKAEVKVRSGRGDTVLSLPADTKFATEFKSGMGNLENEFPTTSDGTFKVSVKSGTGNLHIKKLK